MQYLTEYQRRIILYWLPALMAGGAAGLAFLYLGESPLLRSAGLALCIVGVTLTLRRMGWLLAISGGLALAFSPAFWLQTGGAVQTVPATIVIALGLAAALAVLVVAVSKRPYIALAIALAVFGVVYLFADVGVPRSLRLTVVLAAWLIYMLVNAVLETNPRPDGPPPARLKAQYRAGLLLLLGVGVINEPLFALFIPAVLLGLSQARTRIPLWYWAILAAIVALGVRGVWIEYLDPVYWSMTTADVLDVPGGVPYLVADGFGDPLRWVYMVGFVAEQFTLFGLFLGIIGLSRMARWYPVLGGVSMIAYATFFVFGLGYFGRDRAVLLLPMLMIQVLWMTYAVHALGQWIEKALGRQPDAFQRSSARWLVPAAYLALPLLLLFNIALS